MMILQKVKSTKGYSFIYFLMILSFLTIFGCERNWYVALTGNNEKDLKICISQYEDCEGGGVILAGLHIDEVNEKGELVKPMWVIIPEQKVPVREFTYGQIPNGYKETLKAVPLEYGKIYSILGRFFFKIIRTNDGIKIDTYNLKEFNEKFKWNTQP